MDHLSLASVRNISKKLHLVCRRSRSDMIAALRTLSGLSPYYKDLVETYVRQGEWKEPFLHTALCEKQPSPV